MVFRLVKGGDPAWLTLPPALGPTWVSPVLPGSAISKSKSRRPREYFSSVGSFVIQFGTFSPIISISRLWLRALSLRDAIDPLDAFLSRIPYSPPLMPAEPILILLILGGFAGLILLSISWRMRRSVELIEQWAVDNGFELVDARPRNFLRGPFFLRSTEGQSVYYLTIRDRSGITRSGWARCGGWWLGLISDSVKVRWDE